MSNFVCEHCGEAIIDTPTGYITGCKHYPIGSKGDVEGEAFSKFLEEMGCEVVDCGGMKNENS